MMTDRRLTLSFAMSVALMAFGLMPARADEGSAKPAESVSNIRTAANLEVASPRLAKATTVRTHRRKAISATRLLAAPAGPIATYRPIAETACGIRICTAPIVLFIGITY